jgi:hypothetical protein
MREEVVAEKVVHADDTPVVALVERPDAAASEKKKGRIETRLWVYCAATKPKLYYDFTPNRSREGPTKALTGFHGTLVADAAPSFNEACRRTQSKRAGCYAHVRRKFNDARGADPPRAARALLLVQRLFRLEAAATTRREKDPNFGSVELLALRRRRSRRIVDRLFALLERYRTETLPKSPVGEAVAYALNQREALYVFLDDPDVPVSNNPAEQALRCIATGRKNYLFFGSLRGGDVLFADRRLPGAGTQSVRVPARDHRNPAPQSGYAARRTHPVGVGRRAPRARDGDDDVLVVDRRRAARRPCDLTVAPSISPQHPCGGGNGTTGCLR